MVLSCNYRNFHLACKQQQLYGPVNYRGFRETGPEADAASIFVSLMSQPEKVMVGDFLFKSSDHDREFLTRYQVSDSRPVLKRTHRTWQNDRE